MSGDIEDKIGDILMLYLNMDKNNMRKAKRGISPEWDSMAWVNIIAALQDDFSIDLCEEEYDLISSFDLIS
tara:strand:- start:8700 stop:8912 length:213 start_codon:yes stop_codon:yes gene_type:complete